MKLSMFAVTPFLILFLPIRAQDSKKINVTPKLASYQSRGGKLIGVYRSEVLPNGSHWDSCRCTVKMVRFDINLLIIENGILWGWALQQYEQVPDEPGSGKGVWTDYFEIALDLQANKSTAKIRKVAYKPDQQSAILLNDPSEAANWELVPSGQLSLGPSQALRLGKSTVLNRISRIPDLPHQGTGLDRLGKQSGFQEGTP